MFAIGSRVADRIADAGDVFGRSSVVTGTVVGIDVADSNGVHAVTVDWDAATWSEYRPAESRYVDTLMLAV